MTDMNAIEEMISETLREYFTDERMMIVYGKGWMTIVLSGETEKKARWKVTLEEIEES